MGGDMILEEMSRNYRLTMTVEEALTAVQMDFEELDGHLIDLGASEIEIDGHFIDLGASEIEIDGHFGPHIFFCATSEDAQKIADKAQELVLKEMWSHDPLK